MKRRLGLLLAAALLSAALPSAGGAGEADHSKFPGLQRSFARPEEVTAACLQCHNSVGQDILKTSHWLWSRKGKMAGREGEVAAGKRNIINNFCIALPSNEPRCTSCHIGYGWKDAGFDFSDESRIDCLVCHDQTGTYRKFPAGAGYPAAERKVFPGNNQWYDPPDYAQIAQKVGRPGRSNCGVCHFYGGGGDAVKHGALDSSLADAGSDVDIHMGSDGVNMACVDCHVSERHDIKGQLYSVSSDARDRLNCERCHSARPHTQKAYVDAYETQPYKATLGLRKAPENTFIRRILEKHTERISCQACHIPLYSTQRKTKVWWDWSKAGRRDAEGKPVIEKDADGDVVYDGQKGEFRLATGAVPEYRWFNGEASHVLMGDKIDPKNRPVVLNDLGGVCGEENSKVWPVKVMRGIQPFDPVNSTLIVPKLFGPKGSGAYWSDWDWTRAAAEGMKAAGLPFSGKVDWIETEMYWPIAHLVMDAGSSLSCNDCHARKGRLEGLVACWIPGRDRNLPLDLLGMAMLFGSIVGVCIHGGIRIARSRKDKEG